jgi:DNA-binding MarR family transcriptional regulator
VKDGRDPLRAWLALLSASNAIKKDIDARMRRQFGLSISRFDVLAALDRAGEDGLTAGALSTHLKVTEGNTTQVTAPLVNDGLIRRRASADDGRVAIFQLTKKGEQVFFEMAKANRQWVAEALSPLTPTQISTLRTLLNALNHPASRLEDEAA